MIDWTKPLEHVNPAIKNVVYGGAQTIRDGKPIDDEYLHLVICGRNRTLNYCDDLGRIAKTGKRGDWQQLVRNVTAAPATCKAAEPPIAHDFYVLNGAIENLVEILEGPPNEDGPLTKLASEVNGLRKMMFQAINAIGTAAQEMKACAEAIRAAAGDQQRSFLDANSMLVEELTAVVKTIVPPRAPEATTPKAEAPQAAPAPAPVEAAAPPPPEPAPKPKLIRDMAEIGKAIGGAASIKGAEFFRRQPIMAALETLACLDGVRSMHISEEHEPTSKMTRGSLKYLGEINGGVRIKAYGEEQARVVYVYCDRAASDSVARACRQMSGRRA